LAHSIDLEFPSQSASWPIIVSASEAFSVTGRVVPASSFAQLLLIVQKTEDPKAVSALCQILGRSSGSAFLGLFNSVFFERQLSSTLKIEPSVQIQGLLLRGLNQFLPQMGPNEAMPVAVAVCLAAASGYPSLQVLAFPILAQLIERFKLPSLAPQFSKLSEIALNIDLSITGGFLSSCLKGPNLSSCLRPLIECTNFTPAYFALTAKVIRTSRDNLPALKPFSNTVYPVFKKSVQAALTASNHDEVRGYYSDLLGAYIVLREVSHDDDIPLDALFSFFCVELRNTTEPWIAQADLNGAVAILELFPKKIEIPLIGECLETALYLSPMFLKEIATEISELSLQIARLDGLSDAIWDNLLYSVLNIGFKSETLARVLDHLSTDLVKERFMEFARVVLENGESDKEILSLFRILSSKISDRNLPLMNFVIQHNQNLPKRSSLTFKLLLIFARNLTTFDAQMVSDFVTVRLRKGGMQFLLKLLKLNPSHGLQVAVRGVLNQAAALALSDFRNASLYLRFLIACGETVKSAGFVGFLGKISLACLLGDQQNTDLLGVSLPVIRKWKAEDPEECKKYWEGLPESERHTIMTLLLT
jgi:hypothetical protein